MTEGQLAVESGLGIGVKGVLDIDVLEIERFTGRIDASLERHVGSCPLCT
jgi:hypothetical protein